MPTDHRAQLAAIKTFPQLIAYLRDDLGWPIARDSFDDVDDLFFDFTADELGIDPKTAAKIESIKRLRPLTAHQPWGIFFVKFERKRLPVVALRRILNQVALKKRASANPAERPAWAPGDLLFISKFGEGDERQISFAHFSAPADGRDLPTLKVLGWDNRDTALHLDEVARELQQHLRWPDDEADVDAWRSNWRDAFTLRLGQVVATSKDLSIRLAELARNIRDRIRAALAIETEKGPLTQLMKAFQAALVHDMDADGFADMYAQTIAYGLLSARIADPTKKTADDFAAHMRTNPFLRELMETFLKVGGRRGRAGGPGIDFDELGVSEVIALLDDAHMEAVVRDFGDKNPQEDPVIHFYEWFLKEYDAKKRTQRGVFYTPRPVVSYIVRSVDQLLRAEFGLADGLADTTTWGEMEKRHEDLRIPRGVSPDEDFVQILDPATGTGTFLVEVIDLIHKTMTAKWTAQGHDEKTLDALWNAYVPKHLLSRLHGYELLMAPYAIAHLKIGLKLYETGYRFGSDERARVYLTNALEPVHDYSGTFAFAIPALAHEAAAVNDVKRGQRFTVVIGNPPYSGRSYNLTASAREMVNQYKTCGGERVFEKGALQLEKNLNDDYVKFLSLTQRITEGRPSVAGLITNHSFLENPTLRGLRWHLLAQYSWIRLLDLGGNVARRDRGEDENVFDIVQGVAISLLALPPRKHGPVREIGRLRGRRAEKYSALSEQGVSAVAHSIVSPVEPLFLFRVEDAARRSEYYAGIGLTDLFPLNSTGVKTHRDGFCIDFDLTALRRRIADLVSTDLSDSQIREKYGLEDTHGWALKTCRARLRSDPNWESAFGRVMYRPFDWRHIYFSPYVVELARMEVSANFLQGDNVGLVFMRQVASDEPYSHFGVTRDPVDNRCFYSNRGTMSYAPLYVEHARTAGFGLFAGRGLQKRVMNLGSMAVARFREIVGVRDLSPAQLFGYCYAVFHSVGYRTRYAEFLTIDFPRLVLPRTSRVFSDLAGLGAELVSLHLLESPKVKLATPITAFIGGLNPAVERVSWSKNTVWLDKSQTTGFEGVGEDVWKFQIGGYQVCEKWLKDRKGRTLSKDDVDHYQKIVIALSETIRLMKEIDEVIEQHGGWPGAFQTSEAKAAPAEVVPFRPRTVEPTPAERYVTCVPLVPLKAAAGAFGEPQHIEDGGFEWVSVESRHRLRKGMFVAQVVGKSMEPAIPDGSFCLFRAPVEGSRQGKTVLVQLRDVADPESGDRFTVKRYESEKAQEGDSWTHERILLKPVNPAFAPIVIEHAEDGQLQVVAELLEVLGAAGGRDDEAVPPPEDEATGPEFVLRNPSHQPSLLEAPQESGGDQADDAPADDPPAPAIDPDELPSHIRSLFADRVARDRDRAIRELREGLGYGRTGHVIRETLDNGLRTAVRRGILSNEGGLLKLHLGSIAEYDRGFLKEQFLAALGRGWRSRDDAPRLLARFLGFRRTGTAIEDSVRSVVNGLLREGRLEARKDEIRRVD